MIGLLDGPSGICAVHASPKHDLDIFPATLNVITKHLGLASMRLQLQVFSSLPAPAFPAGSSGCLWSITRRNLWMTMSKKELQIPARLRKLEELQNPSRLPWIVLSSFRDEFPH
jgi:hypothetical protein